MAIAKLCQKKNTGNNNKALKCWKIKLQVDLKTLPVPAPQAASKYVLETNLQSVPTRVHQRAYLLRGVAAVSTDEQGGGKVATAEPAHVLGSVGILLDKLERLLHVCRCVQQALCC